MHMKIKNIKNLYLNSVGSRVVPISNVEHFDLNPSPLQPTRSGSTIAKVPSGWSGAEPQMAG